MRRTALLLVSALTFAACGKSSYATSVTASASLSTGLSGSWSGCYSKIYPGVANRADLRVPVTLALMESSGIGCSGSGSAGYAYAVTGTLSGSSVSLSGTAVSQNESWIFTGSIAGNFISGQIVFKDTTALTLSRTH